MYFFHFQIKDPQADSLMGQREGFAASDIAKINAMYQCGNQGGFQGGNQGPGSYPGGNQGPGGYPGGNQGPSLFPRPGGPQRPPFQRPPFNPFWN